MSKVVSKEEMSALMNATAPKDQVDSKRISGYDFKHPFLISREQNSWTTSISNCRCICKKNVSGNEGKKENQ